MSCSTRKMFYIVHTLYVTKHVVTAKDNRLLETRLEKHADDGHHCKSSVGKFRRQFFGLLRRIGGSQDLESKVSRSSWCARRLILRNFAECHVGQDLSPAGCRHLGDCCKSVGHVGKLQSGGRGQVAWELSSDPWSDTKDARKVCAGLSQASNAKVSRSNVVH